LEFVVVAIDGRMNDFREWEVYIGGGRIPTGISMFDWAKQVTDRGAGEILFTSMNHDGVKTGFAVEATKKIAELVPVPVIASGGAGNMDHFADVFHHGKADAALAASILHYKEIEIKELKKYLAEKGIPIRL